MRYLRRKYGGDSPNVTGLKALADQLASGLSESVTITGHTFEGGSAQGVVTFERLAYLAAVEALIIELDPDNAPDEPASTRYADFRHNTLET